MSWREKITRFLGLRAGGTRPNGVKPWPVGETDPIEELARIINEAQESNSEDERQFADLVEGTISRGRELGARHGVFQFAARKDLRALFESGRRRGFFGRSGQASGMGLRGL